MTNRADRIMALVKQQADTEVVSNEHSETIGLDSVNSNEFVQNVNSDVLVERQDEMFLISQDHVLVETVNEEEFSSDVNLINENELNILFENEQNKENDNDLDRLDSEQTKSYEEDDNDPDYNPSMDAAYVFDSDASEPSSELQAESFEGLAAENNSSEGRGTQNKKRKRSKLNEVDERHWAVNKNKKLRETGKAYYGKKRING
ncbi:hypothetical protein J6590_041081 [Homalodisca vitripennis]|nr:hypothetical protein J6590_041081 [Homalodisca vitripennis]